MKLRPLSLSQVLAELRAEDQRRAERFRASGGASARREPDSPGTHTSRGSRASGAGSHGGASAGAPPEVEDGMRHARAVRAMCRTLEGAGVSAAPADHNEKALRDDETVRDCLSHVFEGQRACVFPRRARARAPPRVAPRRGALGGGEGRLYVRERRGEGLAPSNN